MKVRSSDETLAVWWKSSRLMKVWSSNESLVIWWRRGSGQKTRLRPEEEAPARRRGSGQKTRLRPEDEAPARRSPIISPVTKFVRSLYKVYKFVWSLYEVWTKCVRSFCERVQSMYEVCVKIVWILNKQKTNEVPMTFHISNIENPISEWGGSSERDMLSLCACWVWGGPVSEGCSTAAAVTVALSFCDTQSL